jgi:hypothetical protein
VRDWVTGPSAGFLNISMYFVPRDSIAAYVASGTPVPFGVIAVWFANEA